MFLVARYFECPIQYFSAAFDVLIKILESYRPLIPSAMSWCSELTGRRGGDVARKTTDGCDVALRPRGKAAGGPRMAHE